MVQMPTLFGTEPFWHNAFIWTIWFVNDKGIVYQATESRMNRPRAFFMVAKWRDVDKASFDAF